MDIIDVIVQEIKNAQKSKNWEVLDRALARYWSEISLRQQRRKSA